ncbi:3-isopropylmalate dehydratase small subunit [Prochlorococcus sp. AH-716-K03]|nr:3-isopropylmalate dehydratase small subunit [Prochlorococcus sp. AH-716-K03]
MSIKFKTPMGKISRLNGKCISLVGDDIDTDRIIPARFLKCINFDSLAKSVFDDDRKTLKGNHPFDLETNKGSSILIVNSNFGCGSSREHAPQALMRWGIKAIIGESFADIFYSNCIAIGIPCFTLPKKSIKEIQRYLDIKNLFFEINLFESTAKAEDLKFNLEIKETSKNMFLSGEWDATSKLLENEALIKQKLNDLPYINFNSSF